MKKHKKAFYHFVGTFENSVKFYSSKQQHQMVYNTISNWMTLIRKDQKVDLDSCEFEFNLAQTWVHGCADSGLNYECAGSGSDLRLKWAAGCKL